MIKLKNPYAQEKNYNCFGCSPDNPIGLKMEFFYDEENQLVYSEWKTDDNFEGYFNVLHGGIQATMIDEIASWAIYMLLDTAGVTSEIHVKYRKPVYVDKGKISLTAKVKETQRKFAILDVTLKDGEGNICSQGDVKYFIYPKEIANKRLGFKGKEAYL